MWFFSTYGSTSFWKIHRWVSRSPSGCFLRHTKHETVIGYLVDVRQLVATSLIFTVVLPVLYSINR